LDWMQLLLTAALGVIGGLIFYKLKVPGAMMIGSMIAVAALNVTTGMAYMPLAGKVMAQMAAGAFIACGVQREDLLRLRHIIKPAVTMLLGYLFINIASGFLIWLVSPLDLATALMSGVPGGLTDVPIMAADMGADAPKVATMQFVRMILGIGIFPTLIRKIEEYYRKKNGASTPSGEASGPRTRSKEGFLPTVAVAVICGLIGQLSSVPAGTMLFSLGGVLVLKFVTNKAYIPTKLRMAAQTLAGAYIGCSVGYEDVLELRYLIVPVIIISAFYLGGCIGMGLLIHKKFGMSTGEALLSTTPAGVSDMALIASEMGVGGADVAVMQVVRLVVVVAAFPQIIRLILSLVGA